MENCKRKSSDRRFDDRRMQAMTISIERRAQTRRANLDRREVLSGQVS